MHVGNEQGPLDSSAGVARKRSGGLSKPVVSDQPNSTTKDDVSTLILRSSM